MRISYLIAKDFLHGGGGIEKYTREVGRRLTAIGHEVLVFSTRGSGPCPSQWEGIRICWLPRFEPYWIEKAGGSLSAVLRARFTEPRPDLFHLHSVAAGAMAPFLRPQGVPCVLQMHGVEWKRSRWGTLGRVTLHVLESISVASASSITAVSETQCSYYSDHYRKPVYFIPCGADQTPAPPPSILGAFHLEREKYFFTAVRLVKEKGVHYLISAFRRLPTHWKLVIAGGEGQDRKYVAHLRALAQGDDRIIFVGHVYNPLLAGLYAHAGAYVHASEMEGMSISLLEAMTAERCCIVSDVEENMDLLRGTGLSFRSRDPGDLAQKMHWAMLHEAEARTLGRAASALARGVYSWDGVTRQLEQFYFESIRRSRPKAASRLQSITAPQEIP